MGAASRGGGYSHFSSYVGSGVVMGATMASKFFKPEKNLEFFRLKF